MELHNLGNQLIMYSCSFCDCHVKLDLSFVCMDLHTSVIVCYCTPMRNSYGKRVVGNVPAISAYLQNHCGLRRPQQTPFVFTCLASWKMCDARRVFFSSSAIYVTVPVAPSLFSTNISTTSLEVQWALSIPLSSFDSGTGFILCLAEFVNSSAVLVQSASTSSAASNCTRLCGPSHQMATWHQLHPGTLYTVNVTAFNTVGHGTSSNTLVAATLDTGKCVTSTLVRFKQNCSCAIPNNINCVIAHEFWDWFVYYNDSSPGRT